MANKVKETGRPVPITTTGSIDGAVSAIQLFVWTATAGATITFSDGGIALGGALAVNAGQSYPLLMDFKNSCSFVVSGTMTASLVVAE